ncbi:MAG: metal-dependent hydrolase [Crocinitomicaceae bacterium]|jgi:L-ascorbate metabolism protein UlaG (beta-lactamase superfamily)|nr:metal-dependent hydrolase [Crocinitomicaceae bacterium]MBT6029435.1 metal-dependent hydrolase [Crocinitomicaceae bacterium]MBT6513637.1 metal-dependent hydrolase [Crocinitomicaceae bacterium]MDG2332326.1 metal-dependent hydrolase [Flavobacteriales bacterium]
MKLTFFGHSCTLIDFGSTKILFDPFISGNELASNVDIDSIEANYILVSHGHEDHILDVERIAKRTGAKIIAPYETCMWFAQKGLDGHPMNHGGKWNFDFGTVKMTNAIHSSILPDGNYGGNPAGYVIESEHGNFYYAGDTALTMDMKLIGMQHQLDFAILPIGDNFTMGIDDAVICADFIKCKNIVGVHYDTFGYIKINKEEAKSKFEKAGTKLTLLEIGESEVLN